MKDIKLDTISHDLVISGYDLVIIQDNDQIAQNLKIRLLFLFNEWFLDANKGIPFFEYVCVKNPNIALIDSMMKSTIIETNGITQLLSFSSIYSASARSYAITFKALTETGEIALESLTLG